MRTFEAIESVHQVLSGAGPQEIAIPVDSNTKPALEFLWKELARRQAEQKKEQG